MSILGERIYDALVSGVSAAVSALARAAWGSVGDVIQARTPYRKAVLDRDLTTPPGSPSDGDRYLLPGGATGVWSGHFDEIAEWDGDDGAWSFETPEAGWGVWVLDEGIRLWYDGADWVTEASGVDWLIPAAGGAPGSLIGTNYASHLTREAIPISNGGDVQEDDLAIIYFEAKNTSTTLRSAVFFRDSGATNDQWGSVPACADTSGELTTQTGILLVRIGPNPDTSLYSQWSGAPNDGTSFWLQGVLRGLSVGALTNT